MISVTDVSVELGGKQLLHGVSFEAPAGMVTGLIGPNGAGKSTLLGAVAGDIALSAGEVRLAGVDVQGAGAKELARVRAVMLQDVSVSFEFLVRDVVAMGRRPWEGVASELDDSVIEAAMAAADVAHLAGRDVVTLSGGERARVALARVLAQQTPVIILDEPTAALDIKHQEQVLGLVRQLAQATGVAVLVVLHDLNAAAAYCDRVVCLADGKVVSAGSVAEVYDAQTLTEVYGWPIGVEKNDGRVSVHPQRGTAGAGDLVQLSQLLKGKGN